MKSIPKPPVPAQDQPCALCGYPVGGPMHTEVSEGSWVAVGPAAPTIHVLTFDHGHLRVVHHTGEGTTIPSCAHTDPLFLQLVGEDRAARDVALQLIKHRGPGRVVNLRPKAARMKVRR